jgi:hypothetical protein
MAEILDPAAELLDSVVEVLVSVAELLDGYSSSLLPRGSTSVPASTATSQSARPPFLSLDPCGDLHGAVRFRTRRRPPRLPPQHSSLLDVAAVIPLQSVGGDSLQSAGGNCQRGCRIFFYI